MKVHFVCTGNVFRSRLAEAYLRSKQLKDVTVSSSGTHASADMFGPITDIARNVSAARHLAPYMTKNWQQATPELLNSQDLVVFMQPEHYAFAKPFLADSVKHAVWDIPDHYDFSGETKSERASFGAKTYRAITAKVDELVAKADWR